MTKATCDHTEHDARLRVLVVEDEPDIAQPLQQVLTDEGYLVLLASDGAQAMNYLDREVFDLVIADVRLPEVDGLTIFRRIRQEVPATDVILMSAYGSVEQAVSAMHDRAAHYVEKPFNLEELLGVVHQLERSHVARQRVADESPLLIGKNPKMVRLVQQIDAIAASEASVLITGESGTGKELVARTIHDHSARADRAFVALNAAAFPDTLVDAELFGYEKGAFTGAQNRREGRFRAADGGTLLLDEVAEMSSATQAKLLRVLQEGTFEPLGTNRTVRVDVRILAATNVDMQDYVESHRFRRDLYYRLKVFHLHVPPLRARRSDIPLLVHHMLRQRCGSVEPPVISPRAWAALEEYGYPGNVRELKHAIEHAAILCEGDEIRVEHLPAEFRGVSPSNGPWVPTIRPLASATEEFEREYISRALRQTQGNKTQAAALLQISRKTLWDKVRRYRIG